MTLTQFSLKHSVTVFVFIFIIVIGGLTAYVDLPKESSPDVKVPLIIVTTPYLGVAPGDVEVLVTQQIETELNTLTNIKNITSTSSEGVSSIAVEFNPDVEIPDALQKVRDKVNLAKPDLPPDAEEPIITDINFSDWPIMLANISGDVGLVRLKAIADDLQDEIEKIPGIQEVQISGGLEQEVKVNVDPERLRYYDLALEDVVNAIRNENVTVPGGTIDVGDYKYLVRIDGEFDDPEPLKDIVVKAPQDKPIYIRDVAEVAFGFKERASYARENGLECVTLTIKKRTGENIIKIADQTKKILSDAEQEYHGISITVLADQSREIRMMVDDLENNIISGLILVVLVLFLFLGVRNAIIVSLAIPFSMLISFIVISLLGYTMNMIVLFSLILALGMLVDNAIVIVENIYRHREEGFGPHDAADKGTAEVAWPVIASTITTICAFGPMLLWEGIMGEFMKYLPITLIITLSSSLFVALVISPVLAKTVLKNVKLEQKKKLSDTDVDLSSLPPILQFYRKQLINSMNHRVLSVVLTFTALLGLVFLYGLLGHGVEFFPDSDPRQATVDVIAPTGTQLDVSDEIVRKIEKQIDLTRFPDVKTVVANVGAAADMFGGTASGASHSSRLTLDFLDMQERTQSSQQTLDEIRHTLADVTGARIEVAKQEMGPPTGLPINIELAGDNFAVLGDLAQQVRMRIKDIPGIVDLRDDYNKARPELKLVIDREKAALFGLNTSQIAGTIRTAINGTEASKYRVGEDEYDITVRLRKDRRDAINDLNEITIAHEGKHIPLSSVARIESGGGLGSIQRKNLNRVVTVSSEVEGRLDNEALKDVQTALKDFTLPPGYSLSYTGGNEEQEKAAAFLTRAFMIAIFLILLVLVTQFNSIILPFIILFTVILSLVGVFLGLIVTATPFGIIMTGIGVISLAGVVVNNAIVLIDYIVQLRGRGFDKFEAIVTAGTVRFRPVILTAITTILGLIPLTVGINIDFKRFVIEFGSETSQWWGPMGAAVIFGLAFATFLTLIIVPILYSLLDDLSVWLKTVFGVTETGTTS